MLAVPVMSAAATLANSPILVLGHEEMDADHASLLPLLEKLNEADKQGFTQGFEELCSHVEAHFAREERWMVESNYPGMSEHKDAHARILGELSRFRRRVRQGALTLSRAFVRQELPGRLANHVQNMDAALAAHLNRPI